MQQDDRVNDPTARAALEAARSQLGARRPDNDEPEDQWLWDKLTELLGLPIDSILEAGYAADAQWGGQDVDDGRSGWDWVRYIRHQCNKTDAAMHSGEALGEDSFRARMAKVAALAIAGIKSYDRVCSPSDLDVDPQ